LPVEFYNIFWGSVGQLLVECFNDSFAKGEMSPSQRQAVITLIEKKDQDRCDLKNWQPFSFLNVDAKIASKGIAERMKRLLPDLIHNNRSGYIRSIPHNKIISWITQKPRTYRAFYYLSTLKKPLIA